MIEKLGKRITFANVISLVALFVALGGTVYAANKISGRQIKPNSIPGNRIRKDSLGGAQIDSKKLGKVASAANADNAAALGGAAASTYLQASGSRADGAASVVAIPKFTTRSYVDIISKTFTAPKAGYVFVAGNVTTEDDESIDSGTPAQRGELGIRLRLDETPSELGSSSSHRIGTDAKSITGFFNSGSIMTVMPVTAGPHTVALQAIELGSGDFIQGREISALFFPSGSAPSFPLTP